MVSGAVPTRKQLLTVHLLPLPLPEGLLLLLVPPLSCVLLPAPAIHPGPVALPQGQAGTANHLSNKQTEERKKNDRFAPATGEKVFFLPLDNVAIPQLKT